MRSLRFSAGLTALGLALLLSTGVLAAVPAGTLDQSHECVAGVCNSVNGGQPDAQYPLWYSQNGNDGSAVGLGQTFTAGISGSLTGVELYLTALDATAPATLTVQIESTTSGVPSGTVLATTTVATSDIPFVRGLGQCDVRGPAGGDRRHDVRDHPARSPAGERLAVARLGPRHGFSGAYTDYTGGRRVRVGCRVLGIDVHHPGRRWQRHGRPGLPDLRAGRRGDPNPVARSDADADAGPEPTPAAPRPRAQHHAPANLDDAGAAGR